MNLEQAVTEILSDDLAFRTWLSVQDPGKTIGWSGDPCRCPIASFLMSAMGHDLFYVYGLSIVAALPDLKGHVISAPRWVGQFTAMLDQGYFYGKTRPVSAQVALRALDTID